MKILRRQSPHPKSPHPHPTARGHVKIKVTDLEFSRNKMCNIRLAFLSGDRSCFILLAYSWARPAVLVTGKGRRGILLFLHFHSCSSFFPVSLLSPLLALLSVFSLSLGDNTKCPTKIDISLNPNTIKTLYQDCSSHHDLSKNIAAMGWGLFSLYVNIENF